MRRLWADRGGASAVEFAIVLPVFILLVLGSMSAAFLVFAVSSLNYAVQDAARCAAVNKTLCSNATTTAKYALSKYAGPPIAPVFTYSTAGCGNTVSATGTFSLEIIPEMSNIPLKASACHPAA
ncbi:MAG: TadE/TadG family type IV pilus assembly protein [Phenylobacterium sp.]